MCLFDWRRVCEYVCPPSEKIGLKLVKEKISDVKFVKSENGIIDENIEELKKQIEKLKN